MYSILIGDSLVNKFKLKNYRGFHSILSFRGLHFMEQIFDRCTFQEVQRSPHQHDLYAQFLQAISAFGVSYVSACLLSNDYLYFLSMPTAFIISNIPLALDQKSLLDVLATYGSIAQVDVSHTYHVPTTQLRSIRITVYYNAIFTWDVLLGSTALAVEDDVLSFRPINRRLMKVSAEFAARWRNFTSQQRREFDLEGPSRHMIPRSIRAYLAHQALALRKRIISVLANSPTNAFILWTVLERSSTIHPDLDVLFGLLNSLLLSSFPTWNAQRNILNSYQEPVHLHMLDMQSLYWNAPLPRDHLFIDLERLRPGERVHRTEDAMEPAVRRASDHAVDFTRPIFSLPAAAAVSSDVTPLMDVVTPYNHPPTPPSSGFSED